MADFVDGVFVKTVDTQYGEIIKLSFDIVKFNDFLDNCEDTVVGDNGRRYFNADIKKSKNKKYYMSVDTYIPKKSDYPFGDE